MGTQSLGSRQKKQSVAPAGNASQLVARPQSMPVSTAPDSATESLDDGWGDDSEALPSAIEVKVTSEALAPARVPDFGPLGRIHAVDDQEEPPISRNRSGAGRHASGQEGQTVAAQTLAVVGTTKKAVTAAPRNGVPGGRSGRARQTTMAGGFVAPTGEVMESHAAPSVITSGRRVPSSLPPRLEEEESDWDVPLDPVLTPTSVLSVGKTAASSDRVASDRTKAARPSGAPVQQPTPLGTTGVHAIAKANHRRSRSAALPNQSQSSGAPKSQAKSPSAALQHGESLPQKRAKTAVTEHPQPAFTATATPVLAPAIDITIEPSFPRGSADSEARDNLGLPIGGADTEESSVEPALSALAWEQQRVSAGRRTVLWCCAAALVLLAAAGGWAYVGKHAPFTGRQPAVVRVQPAAVPKPVEAPEKAIEVPEKPAQLAAPIQEAITSQPAPIAEQAKNEDAKAKSKPRRRVTSAASRAAPSRPIPTEDAPSHEVPSSGIGESAPQPQIVGDKALKPSKEPITAEL
ncbi:MAG TPA: hypothetical protein VKP30_01765 [Polyangiaceae bacterium]|nr:hypothetical protein [Polyangiaceae bacterium]